MNEEIKDFLFVIYSKDLGKLREIKEFNTKNKKIFDRLSQRYGLFKSFEKDTFEKTVGMLEHMITDHIRELVGFETHG